MTPDPSLETRIAVLETEVHNLKEGQRVLVDKIDKLTEKLNAYMLRTAVGTALLTGGSQVAINYVGGS